MISGHMKALLMTSINGGYERVAVNGDNFAMVIWHHRCNRRTRKERSPREMLFTHLQNSVPSRIFIHGLEGAFKAFMRANRRELFLERDKSLV